jgi:hypothetical protein
MGLKMSTMYFLESKCIVAVLVVAATGSFKVIFDEICRLNMTDSDIITCKSYRNSQQDATVYQNLLFHVYMKLSRPANSTSNNFSRMQNQRLLVQF